MTSHAELSRDLALAIGYAPESVRIIQHHGDEPLCQVHYGTRHGDGAAFYRVLDYRSPDVAMPLLAWLMVEHDGHAFPMMSNLGLFIRITCGWEKRFHTDADTLEEAIARAVIAVGGK